MAVSQSAKPTIKGLSGRTRATRPRLRDEASVLFDTAMDAWEASHPALPIAVAYSGGADSTALLHACAQRWPGATVAWHVNHGLQAAATDFENHCRAICLQLHVPLLIARVDARAAPGQSPEEIARLRRYAAYERLAALPNPVGRPSTVALAQHADDQVETLLIALLRGAGLPGLAAMPQTWEHAGQHYVRPLLRVPRTAIRGWLTQHAISWIEDPTNADPRYLRNHIRHTLTPVLDAMAPTFRNTFARSAAHAAEAQALLQELALQDLAITGDPPALFALQQLSNPRLKNVLRHWLRHTAGRAPSNAQLQELQRQIHACTTRGHRIHLRIAGGWVTRAQTVLRWTASS